MKLTQLITRDWLWLLLVVSCVSFAAWFVFTSSRPTIAPAIVALFGLVVWLAFWPEWRFRKALAARAPLSDEQFFSRYYAGTDVPRDIPIRLRPIYCTFFQIDYERLHPDDRPPALTEGDTSELTKQIEEEFGVSISDTDAERINGSFDSIVQFLSERTASHR